MRARRQGVHPEKTLRQPHRVRVKVPDQIAQQNPFQGPRIICHLLTEREGLAREPQRRRAKGRPQPLERTVRLRCDVRAQHESGGRQHDHVRHAAAVDVDHRQYDEHADCERGDDRFHRGPAHRVAA